MRPYITPPLHASTTMDDAVPRAKRCRVPKRPRDEPVTVPCRGCEVLIRQRDAALQAQSEMRHRLSATQHELANMFCAMRDGEASEATLQLLRATFLQVFGVPLA